MNRTIVSAPTQTAGADGPDAGITVSVVSHGHGALLVPLLRQLCEAAPALIRKVVVTHNLPAPAVTAPESAWPFELVEQFNPSPWGFGANHNQAFKQCHTPYFCVLNPDIEIPDPAIWSKLLAQATQAQAGCIYPRLVNPDGTRQDSEREAVTPLALFRRRILRRPTARMDWVSAAFWVVPSPVYRALGGFDEAYFMYCEDTEFCLRLRSAGWALYRAEVDAVHVAGRQSHRNFRHLFWHVRSLLRLWLSPALRDYLALRRNGDIR